MYSVSYNDLPILLDPESKPYVNSSILSSLKFLDNYALTSPKASLWKVTTGYPFIISFNLIPSNDTAERTADAKEDGPATKFKKPQSIIISDLSRSRLIYHLPIQDPKKWIHCLRSIAQHQVSRKMFELR